MWWVLIIPPAIWIGKKIVDALQEEPATATSQRTPPARAARAARPPSFHERGDLFGPKVVVIGRTGAGKSSLINMLVERDALAVGPVGSTTRWIEGVRGKVAGKTVIFVDTPGYGEAHTANNYRARLVNSVRKHAASLKMILLVLQADAKAHAEDRLILGRILAAVGQVPVAIILNQVDKILPVRRAFAARTWPAERRKKTLKSRHVSEKLAEVCRQFELDPECVEPSVSAHDAFNRSRILQLIGRHLNHSPG